MLRFPQPDDAPSLLAAIDAGRSSLAPWLEWAVTDNRTLPECIYSIEHFRRRRERTDPPPETFMIGIFDRATGDVIGGTSFHRIAHAQHQAEVGYWIRADRQRQGLCTEAVRALITWGFTPQDRGSPRGWGFRRIEIYCAASNEASRGVPRKLGLREEIHRHQSRWLPGRGWGDELGWGVLAEEWMARHQ